MTRPTLLKMAASCGYSATLYKEGAPQDDSGFHVGTVTHEVLHAMAEGRDVQALLEQLAATGRPAPDPTGPIPVRDILEGSELARQWVEAHPLPASGDGLSVFCEHRFSIAELDMHTRIDRVVVEEQIDDDGDVIGVLRVGDYKTSWQAGEDELDTVQRKAQAVAVADYLDAWDVLILEVYAVRKRRVYSRTIYRDQWDELRAAWLAELRILKAKEDAGEPAVGAACLSCSYAMHCRHVWEPAREAHSDVGGLVTRWLASKAQTKAMEALLRPVLSERAVDVPGGRVGPYEKMKGEVVPGGYGDALSEAMAHFGMPLTMENSSAIANFAGALAGASVTQVKAIAKAIYPSRSEAKARREWVSRFIVDLPTSAWGFKKS